MRPLDQFFSQLVRLEQSLQSVVLEQETADHLMGEFSRLLAPVIGGPAAEDLCFRTLERIRGKAPAALQRVGNMAAFFLGEYDDSLKLEDEDWIEIQETLEDASGEMNIDILTDLMGELLSIDRLK
jgi:hypothetical protein